MRIDLFEKIPFLKKWVKLRSFQSLLIIPTLVLFYIFLLAGVFGSPVGNRNIIVIFVWILWWFVLITFLVPFGSRVWCTMCPFPFFGEWFQRRKLISVGTGKPSVGRNKMYGLRKRWPKFLSNIWLQNIGFLTMATFNALLVTRPMVSVIALGGLVIIATIIHMIYRQRAFCMYICPVSGFLSLYSMTSMVELRSKNKEVCGGCKTKSCLTGNEKGWGCPWFQHAEKMDRNNYCGLCMECMKSCPNDNITVSTRPFASDTTIKGYDEAWKGFIMLTLALAYSVVLLGPYGTLKDWANLSEMRNWSGFAIYATSLWLLALVVLPSIYYLTVLAGHRLAKSTVSIKDMFIRYSYVFVPLGLLAWIAFSLPLVMVNGSYIIAIISDPFGWGWDLFGTANFPWTPLYPEYGIFFQMLFLVIGLYYSMKRGFEIAVELQKDSKAAFKSMLPLNILLLTITVLFIKLFVG